MRIDNIRDLRASSYRRCLRVTLLFFVIQLFAVSQLRAEDNIVIPTLKIEPGTKQQLVFQLENRVAYTAFQAEIYFPDGITPVMTDGEYDVRLSDSRITNHTITANITSSGALKVVAYSSNNEKLKGNSGDLFYIDITSEATFEGPATIEAKGILFTKNSDHKEIAFADASGVVDTHTIIKGDANGDGEIDVADIDIVIEHIDEIKTDANKAADVNGDGVIDVADIDFIIERIV